MEEGRFYKYNDGEWFAVTIATNANYHLTVENHGEHDYPVDGWEWHDEPPQEYIEWLEKQEDYDEK